MRTRSLASPVAAAALFMAALAPAPASAQLKSYYTVTTTYQFSVLHFNEAQAVAYGQGFHSWGLMLGLVRPRSWLSPHVWLQRYSHEGVCPPDPKQLGGCDSGGWSVSVGPALNLINRGPWWSQATADVELGGPSRPRTGGVNGGAALHVGVHAGGFIPQVFTRLTRFSGTYYNTFGLGLRFELR